MSDITLLHTSPIHVATFDALQGQIAPAVSLHHVVRPDWLSRARENGLSALLLLEIAGVVENAQGRVLCTCTSIGPLAQQAGAIRIDAPMMQQAALAGGNILMVFALPSTRAPSLALLENAVKNAGSNAIIHLLDLSRHWHLFEAGEVQKFSKALANSICDTVTQRPMTSIVLAQASMAGAAPLLPNLGAVVLTSPESAFRAALPAVD